MLQIGRYRLVEKLSDGFPGARWSARPQDAVETSDTLVSLRTVSVGSVSELVDAISEAAFWAMEVELNGQPAVLDVVAGSGTVSCVAPFHPGDSVATLRERLFVRKTPAPTSVALRIGLDVLADLRTIADAVAGDEEAGAFAFGGVNPDSILIAFDGRTRIIDVAVSAVASQRRLLTRRDRCRLAYDVPERCGTDGRVDERADVFAVGVLLWELLTGRELFRGNHAEDVVSSVLNHQIETLDSTYTRRTEAFEPGVSDLVARALQREPTDRFQSVGELIEAIEGLDVDPCQRPDVSAFIKQSAGLGSLVMQQHLASLKPAGRSNFPTPPPAAGSDSVPPPAVAIPPAAPLPQEAKEAPALLIASSRTASTIPPAVTHQKQGGRRIVMGLLLVAAAILAFALLRPDPEAKSEPQPAAAEATAPVPAPEPVAVDAPPPVEPPPVEPPIAQPEPVVPQPDPEAAAVAEPIREPKPTPRPAPRPTRKPPKPIEGPTDLGYVPDDPF